MRALYLGIILLIAGAGLLWWGYTISESLEGKISETLTGSPGDKAMIMYIAGAICVALGVITLAVKK